MYVQSRYALFVSLVDGLNVSYHLSFVLSKANLIYLTEHLVSERCYKQFVKQYTYIVSIQPKRFKQTNRVVCLYIRHIIITLASMAQLNSALAQRNGAGSLSSRKSL